MWQIKMNAEWQFYFRIRAHSVPCERQGCDGSNNKHWTNGTLCPKAMVQEAAESLGVLRSGVAECLRIGLCKEHSIAQQRNYMQLKYASLLII